jgi:hypothetical protein
MELLKNRHTSPYTKSFRQFYAELCCLIQMRFIKLQRIGSKSSLCCLVPPSSVQLHKLITFMSKMITVHRSRNRHKSSLNIAFFLFGLISITTGKRSARQKEDEECILLDVRIRPPQHLLLAPHRFSDRLAQHGSSWQPGSGELETLENKGLS